MNRPLTLPADNPGLASERIRARMVERVRELGVRDPRVLAVMRRVPRHRFVDPALASRAYEDTALPIGHGQTMSQPYVVARTAELALIGIVEPARARVLEIGTGCGYAAAILAGLFGSVLSIERIRPLHELARGNLRALRIANLRLALGDGALGLPADAPYDAIVAAAAADEVPAAWIEQLRSGGRIVAPIGDLEQQMTVVIKDAQGRVQRQATGPVRFVPLKGGVC
jgi:protein-L-isoaspartate(D-aspartate) O-methyltransferase